MTCFLVKGTVSREWPVQKEFMVQLKSSKSEHVQLKGQSPREGAVPSRTRCFLEDERPDKLNTFF